MPDPVNHLLFLLCCTMTAAPNRNRDLGPLPYVVATAAAAAWTGNDQNTFLIARLLVEIFIMLSDLFMNRQPAELFTHLTSCASECAICQETGEGPAKQINLCRHTFHAACIDPWLARNSTCPMCRAVI